MSCQALGAGDADTRHQIGRLHLATLALLVRWSGWWQTPVLGMAYTALDAAFGNNGKSFHEWTTRF